MQFWLPCWKTFAGNLKCFRLKCEMQYKKCFPQRRCFPLKQSCGHVECSSDRRANKVLRDVRKKLAYIRLKNLETNALLSTVLENNCSKTWKIPLKIWKTIGKVLSSKKILLINTILWTPRVQCWQTSQKNFP